MIDTKLPATPGNLIALVRKIATPDTLNKIAGAWDTCPISERLELVMDCYYTFDQEYIIVKIAFSDTWGLILDTLDSDGDNKEYLELSNAGTVREWHL